jgi:hypothetical protein
MGRSGPLQSTPAMDEDDGSGDVGVGKGNMEPLRVSDLNGLSLCLVAPVKFLKA